MENLPQEIHDLIGKFLGSIDLNNLRLTSKIIGQKSASLRFESITISHSTKGVRNLEQINSSELLSPLVQRISSRSIAWLYPFDDFDYWLERIWLPDEAPSVHDENEGEDRPMSGKEWENLPLEEKRALYNEYVSEQVDADTERRQLADDLLTRGRLNRALSNFTNLTAFVQHHAENPMSIGWRRLRFALCEDSFCDEVFGQIDDAEAVYSFSILSALGHSRTSLTRLQTLCFNSSGPGFLTASRLWHLSVDKDHRKIRELRKKGRHDVGADSLASRVDRDTIKMFGKVPSEYEDQLATIRKVFERIIHLDICVCEDDTIGALSSIAPTVTDLLCYAKSVQELNLAFGHDSAYWTPECYEDRGYELLQCLTDEAPWSQLRSLRLSIVTEASALLGFLRSLSATLEELSLEDMVLIPRIEGNEEDTWNWVLPEIAQGLPRLKFLDFVGLVHSPFRSSGSSEEFLGGQYSECHDCRTRKSAIIRGLLESKQLLDLEQTCQH
jgi:hypothetical protein